MEEVEREVIQELIERDLDWNALVSRERSRRRQFGRDAIPMSAMASNGRADETVLSHIDQLMLSIEEMDPSLGKQANITEQALPRGRVATTSRRRQTRTRPMTA